MDRRARLHRALDAVIDRSTRAWDTEDYRQPGARQWDNPNVRIYQDEVERTGKMLRLAQESKDRERIHSAQVAYTTARKLWENAEIEAFVRNKKAYRPRGAGIVKDGFTAKAGKEAAMASLGGFLAFKDATYTAPNHAFTFGKYKGELIKGICAKCGRPLTADIHSSKEDLERYAKMKDAAQYEVRKSRGNDAWAVFKIGDDFPVTSWTNSKAAAMIDARHLNGGTTVKARPKSQETAAREVAKRTELNPVVRNYFKLDS